MNTYWDILRFCCSCLAPEPINRRSQMSCD